MRYPDVQQITEDQGGWPAWTPPASVSAVGPDGYGGIARYVSPECLTGLLDAFPEGERARVVSRTHTRARDLDRLLALSLYDRMLAAWIPYAGAPWHAGAGQLIRDPEWMLQGGAAATCIDLTVLYAGLALREGLAVHIVLLRGRSTDGHAGIAVRLGVGVQSQGQISGTAPIAVGVSELEYPDDLAASHDVLLLDLTLATAARGLSGEQASAELLHLVQHEAKDQYVHFVDVAARHLVGDLPLSRPRRRRALLGRLPEPATPQPFEAHRPKLRELRDLVSGVVVLTGPQGVGKSSLALLQAQSRHGGFGWWLTASSPKALTTSLAEAEIAERRTSFNDVVALDLDSLAKAALIRLRESRDPWVVVLDNADDGPESIGAQLPQPGAGQTVIVTSTSPPESWHPHQVIAIDRLSDADVLDRLPDPRLAGAVAGTPLLLTAYSRLLRHHSELVAAAAGATVDGTVEDGVRLYLDLLVEALGGDHALIDRLAWLAPDAIDRSLAGRLKSSPGQVQILIDLGFLSEAGGPQISLHRLFGAAVRRIQQAQGRSLTLLVDLLADGDVRTHLVRYGDARLTAQIAGVLASAVPGTPEVGPPLAALAALQEMHDAGSSPRTFERAAEELDPQVFEHRDPLADCLHGLARKVNQAVASTEAELDQAIAWCGRAIELRGPQDVVGRARHQALMSLLRQRRIRQFLHAPDEIERELRTVLSELEDSWLNRHSLGQGHPELDRARFNRAGVRIALAQVVPTREATALLAEAADVYAGTREFREKFYPAPNPLTAASIHGQATAAYYTALLSPDVDPTTQLSDAASAANLSLDLRTQLGNQGDVAKCLAILAKISLARLRAMNQKGLLMQTFSDAQTELHLGDR